MNMFADRTQLPEKSRLFLLERDAEETEGRLTSVEATVRSHGDELLVMRTRAAVYAALGAFAGAGLMSLVVGVAVYFITH